MTDESNETDAESKPLSGLSDDEVKAVEERKGGSPKVIHEVIRLEGDEELDRPFLSLLLSGFAAGVSISVSILAETYLSQRLPDTDWAKLISGFGYTVGFVIVIMGRLQLFTENTIVVILPIATHPSLRNFGRLIRLWAIVFLANMAGTLLVAYAMAHDLILNAAQLETAMKIATEHLDHSAATILLHGIPAGFLVASIAWILPNARGGEFWLIMLITYVIAIGGLSHVVAGSGEAWLLWLSGNVSFSGAAFGFIGPALIGNILGGTGLFAVLAHGQVRREIGETEGKGSGKRG